MTTQATLFQKDNEWFRLAQEKGNRPEEFNELTQKQQTDLLDWISRSFKARKSFDTARTSYGLKHEFERTKNGFYVSNGQFKGAMLAAGYKAKDERDLNWTFNASYKRVVE